MMDKVPMEWKSLSELKKAVLSTNHWKGERKRSFCLQAEQAETHRNHDLTIVGFSES